MCNRTASVFIFSIIHWLTLQKGIRQIKSLPETYDIALKSI